MNSAASSPAGKGDIHCKINVPDERTPHEVTMKKTDTGLDLLDRAYEALKVVEKDYFGISFSDSSGCRRWLETHKTLAHQFNKLRGTVSLNLKIKFYPNDPLHLKNEFSRYLLYRQVRQDIFENRIYVPETAIPRLLGFLLQAEFLDWSPELPDSYVDDVKFKPEPLSAAVKDQAIAAHKTMTGLTIKEMEIQFVQEVASFASYGLDMYTCKDQEDAQLIIGIGCNGVSTFAFGKVTHAFKWREILKMYYEGKQFFCTIRLREYEEKASAGKSALATVEEEEGGQSEKPRPQRDLHKHLCAFRCQSATQAKVMWKSAMERKTFFTAVSSNENDRMEKRSALSLVLRRSTTFNFHGRVQREVIKDDIERDSQFVRYSWASNTLPRMGKAHNSSAQTQQFLMTPSPSPSCHQSDTTLGASKAESEATMIDTQTQPVATDQTDQAAQAAPPPPQTTTANNPDLYNTPPDSPELNTEQGQTSRVGEDSGNLTASDIEANATFSLHSNFGVETEVSAASCQQTNDVEVVKGEDEQLLRTYSTKEDDDLTGGGGAREISSSSLLEDEGNGTMMSNDTAPVITTTAANLTSTKANLTTCYHRSANAVPREVKSKKSQSSSLVLKTLAFVVMLIVLIVALFELPLTHLQQLPFIENIRHVYYEPMRQAVVPRLQKVFGGR